MVSVSLFFRVGVVHHYNSEETQIIHYCTNVDFLGLCTLREYFFLTRFCCYSPLFNTNVLSTIYIFRTDSTSATRHLRGVIISQTFNRFRSNLREQFCWRINHVFNPHKEGKEAQIIIYASCIVL